MTAESIDMIRIAEEAKQMIENYKGRLGIADPNGMSFATFLATEGLMIEFAGRDRRAGADFRYRSYQHMVLATGDYFRNTVGRLPEGVEPAPPRECFRNALMLAQTDEKYVYYEGYATTTSTHIPVLHAWCVDAETGFVVDPTWASIEYPSEDVEGYYIGIPFDTEFVMRRTLHTQHWGVIGNDWMPNEDGIPFMALSCGFRFDKTNCVATSYDVEEAA